MRLSQASDKRATIVRNMSVIGYATCSPKAEWYVSSSSEGNSEVIDLLHDILTRLPPAQKHVEEASRSSPANLLAFTAVDHVIEWPIFGTNQSGHWAPFCLLATAQGPNSHHKATSANGTHQLDWDEIPSLLTKFLRMAHIMNPILNCPTLIKYGRAVVELGPQWDSRTCLVVSIYNLFMSRFLIHCMSRQLTDGTFYVNSSLPRRLAR